MALKSWWLIVSLSAYASGEAVAADAANGGRLAERWCTACHAVDTAQKSGGTDAPPFAGVANRPGFDAGTLALFLLYPHPKMPDLGLTREAAADLAAYIAKQAK